jgi:sterol desaturase/sphingolipid hydroxylase (fatty acid hydroxylase superfamily)
MTVVMKLIGYFMLWGLWSYSMHAFAHSTVKRRINFMRYLHMKHHAYAYVYSDSKSTPWHDYFFWFGNWRSSLDIYITFTIPLVALALYDPVPGCILLGFHYLYEVFLSRRLDHNPNITGAITKVLPIGSYHMRHHSDVHCNFSFYLTIWDHVFGTTEAKLERRRDARQRRGSERVVVPDELRPNTRSEP